MGQCYRPAHTTTIRGKTEPRAATQPQTREEPAQRFEPQPQSRQQPAREPKRAERPEAKIVPPQHSEPKPKRARINFGEVPIPEVETRQPGKQARVNFQPQRESTSIPAQQPQKATARISFSEPIAEPKSNAKARINFSEPVAEPVAKSHTTTARINFSDSQPEAQPHRAKARIQFSEPEPVAQSEQKRASARARINFVETEAEPVAHNQPIPQEPPARKAQIDFNPCGCADYDPDFIQVQEVQSPDECTRVYRRRTEAQPEYREPVPTELNPGQQRHAPARRQYAGPKFKINWLKVAQVFGVVAGQSAKVVGHVAFSAAELLAQIAIGTARIVNQALAQRAAKPVEITKPKQTEPICVTPKPVAQPVAPKTIPVLRLEAGKITQRIDLSNIGELKRENEPVQQKKTDSNWKQNVQRAS